MLQKRVSAVPVVEADGTLVGLLSEKDLFRALYPTYKEWIEHTSLYTDFEEMERGAIASAGRTIDEVMSRRLVTAERTTPVLKVGALMVASGIHQVPVVERGKLIGMVSRGEIYRAILEQYFNLKR
jgi:CBS domain-containing protein